MTLCTEINLIVVLIFADKEEEPRKTFVASKKCGSKQDTSKAKSEASDGKAEDKKSKKSCKVQ